MWTELGKDIYIFISSSSLSYLKKNAMYILWIRFLLTLKWGQLSLFEMKNDKVA